MALTNFIITVAAVSAAVMLLRTDVKQSATIFRRNMKQIRSWLEEESASAANMSNRKTAHQWTFDATQIMLNCAVEAYGACGSNKKGVHKAIAEKFNNAVQNNPAIAPIDESKIRNKYDSLRREWLKWDGLMNKTGAGWDSAKQTISGSDEWWEDRVNEFGPSILKFRRRPIENLELMQQLFHGTNATGQTSYTPSATVQPSQADTPPTTQSSFDRTWAFDGFFDSLDETQEEQIPNLNSPSNPLSHQTPVDPPLQQTPVNRSLPQTPVDPPLQQTSRRGSRRRRGDNEDNMAELLAIIRERQAKKSRTHSESPNTGGSVESTGNSANYANMVARIQRLGEGGEFDIAEAILFVMEPDKKEVFLVLPDEIAKSWLISGMAEKRHTKEYQTFQIKQGGGN